MFTSIFIQSELDLFEFFNNIKKKHVMFFIWRNFKNCISRFTDGNGLSYNCFRQPDVSFYFVWKEWEKKGEGVKRICERVYQDLLMEIDCLIIALDNLM